jgi:hypothetical protein
MNCSPALKMLSRCRYGSALALCLLPLAGACQAGDATVKPETTLWLAASDHALDQLRGGFDIGAGLVVSFGITRAVFINGQLVTSTSFQVGDVTKLTSAQAEVLRQQVPTQAQFVQNGGGNTVEASSGAVPLSTYIQNTLNNQTIRNQTVIQATSSGLSVMKGLNLQSTLNDSINNAVRNR